MQQQQTTEAPLTEEAFLALEQGSDYPPPLTDEESEQIRQDAQGGTRSLKSPPRADVNLQVPYIHQRHDTADDFHGAWACGPTSVAMILAYYGLLEPRPIHLANPVPHESPYGWYLSNRFTHNGRTFDKSAATQSGAAIGLYGSILDQFNGLWLASAGATGGAKGILPVLESFMQPIGNRVRTIMKPKPEDVIASLDEGHPVILSGDVFTWKHILVIRGYYRDPASGRIHWIVNDPDGYQVRAGYDGGNVVYAWEEIHDPQGANRGGSKYMFRISGPRGAPAPAPNRTAPLTAASPLLGPPSGSREPVAAYLKRTLPDGHEYTDGDVDTILAAYWKHAPAAGVDPYLAVMQAIYDTGGLQSPDAARPHRNPARLGQGGAPGGVQSFLTWEASVQAHVAHLKNLGPGKTLRDLRGPDYAEKVIAVAQAIAKGS